MKEVGWKMSEKSLTYWLEVWKWKPFPIEQRGEDFINRIFGNVLTQLNGTFASSCNEGWDNVPVQASIIAMEKSLY